MREDGHPCPQWARTDCVLVNEAYDAIDDFDKIVRRHFLRNFEI